MISKSKASVYSHTLNVRNMQHFRKSSTGSSINCRPESLLEGFIFDKPLQEDLKLLKELSSKIITSSRVLWLA